MVRPFRLAPPAAHVAFACGATLALAACGAPDGELTLPEARERCADALVANGGPELRRLRPQLEAVAFDGEHGTWNCTFATQGAPIRVVLHPANGRVQVLRG